MDITEVFETQTAWLAIAATTAALFIPAVWSVMRHYATLVHEIGHAFTGFITGGTLSGISLKMDSSGETYTKHSVTKGRLSIILTTLAGYPAPGIVAVLLGASVLTNQQFVAWWGLLIMAGICVIFARSLFTFVSAAIFAAPSVYFLWFDNSEQATAVENIALLVFAIVLFKGAVSGLVDLTKIVARDRNAPNDAFYLRERAYIPTSVSMVLLWLLSIASVVGTIYGVIYLPDMISDFVAQVASINNSMFKITLD